MKLVKIVTVNVTNLAPHLCLSSFPPLAQATVGSVQRSPVESSYSHQLHREQRRSHSAGTLLALNTLFKTHFSKLESICVKGMFHFSKIGHRGPAAIALLSLSCEQSNHVRITLSHLCLHSRVKNTTSEGCIHFLVTQTGVNRKGVFSLAKLCLPGGKIRLCVSASVKHLESILLVKGAIQTKLT